MCTRVLIVDDHAPFRTFARLLLTAEGFDIVGEAGDGAGAISAARDLEPEVVLLDVQPPDIDGFGVAEVLAGHGQAPAVVLVSSRSRDDYGARLTGSAARGFIGKAELSGDELRRVLGNG
jgi:DNA-binding NarL/FixJ family response regulator